MSAKAPTPAPKNVRKPPPPPPPPPKRIIAEDIRFLDKRSSNTPQKILVAINELIQRVTNLEKTIHNMKE